MYTHVNNVSYRWIEDINRFYEIDIDNEDLSKDSFLNDEDIETEDIQKHEDVYVLHRNLVGGYWCK